MCVCEILFDIPYSDNLLHFNTKGEKRVLCSQQNMRYGMTGKAATKKERGGKAVKEEETGKRRESGSERG